MNMALILEKDGILKDSALSDGLHTNEDVTLLPESRFFEWAARLPVVGALFGLLTGKRAGVVDFPVVSSSETIVVVQAQGVKI
jgi:hypothetical protein